jgi:hypothetical protein
MEDKEDSLIQKLGISPKYVTYTLHAPDNYLEKLSTPITIEALVCLNEQINWIQAFYESEHALRLELAAIQSKLSFTGQLWICWPKKTSTIPSNLSDIIVRKIGLENGLVDVKVAAINETWSGLKFVYRRLDRKV